MKKIKQVSKNTKEFWAMHATPHTGLENLVHIIGTRGPSFYGNLVDTPEEKRLFARSEVRLVSHESPKFKRGDKIAFIYIVRYAEPRVIKTRIRLSSWNSLTSKYSYTTEGGYHLYEDDIAIDCS